MKQEKGEPVRKYVGRVRNLALVSEYMVACGCGKTVSYAEQVIKDQVIAGLQDPDIKVDVLSHDKVNVWTLPDLVNFVESKETGKLSMAILGGMAWRPGWTGRRRSSLTPRRSPRRGCVELVAGGNMRGGSVWQWIGTALTAVRKGIWQQFARCPRRRRRPKPRR